MTYRTIIPTQAQIEMFENDMKNLTVENLNLEGIENCSKKFKEELVADAIAFATSFKNGTLQVCEGEISDILDEIFNEALENYETGLVTRSQANFA